MLHHFRGSLDLLERTRDLCLSDDEWSDLLLGNDYEVAYWSEWLTYFDTSSPPNSLFLSLLRRLRGTLRREELAREYDALFPEERGLPRMHTVSFIMEHAVDWMMDQVSGSPQPFLGYVHVLPPHAPYVTRREFKGMFQDGWIVPSKPLHFFSKQGSQEREYGQRRKYDEYIAYADAEFGRFYDFLLRTGALDNTYLVVTSDHGEMFERGIFGHFTETLYEPLIRVPLLVSAPGQSRREDVHVATNSVDLLPTLLHVTGQPIPDWCEGQVLPPHVDEDGSSDRSIYSVEAKENPIQAPLTKGTVALIKGQYKLIHYFGYPGYQDVYELYDLASDPEELHSLPDGMVAAELRQELEEKLKEVNQPYMRG
jgi:arylsulfatase A-like enzyme